MTRLDLATSRGSGLMQLARRGQPGIYPARAIDLLRMGERNAETHHVESGYAGRLL